MFRDCSPRVSVHLSTLCPRLRVRTRSRAGTLTRATAHKHTHTPTRSPMARARLSKHVHATDRRGPHEFRSQLHFARPLKRMHSRAPERRSSSREFSRREYHTVVVVVDRVKKSLESFRSSRTVFLPQRQDFPAESPSARASYSPPRLAEYRAYNASK